MIEKIVHAAKQTVNAMVDSHNAALWPSGICFVLVVISIPANLHVAGNCAIGAPIQLMHINWEEEKLFLQQSRFAFPEGNRGHANGPCRQASICSVMPVPVQKETNAPVQFPCFYKETNACTRFDP